MKSLTINPGHDQQELHDMEYTNDRLVLLFRAVFIFCVFCALMIIFFLSLYY